MRTSIASVVVSVAMLAAAVAAFPFGKDSGVVELTPKTLPAFLNTHKPVFLMFYAPWCGHCKSLHPDYEKFGKSVKDVVRVGAVNADQYREIGSQYGVQGFPTLKYWKMGDKKGMKPTDYQGQRSHSALHNAAVREITSAGVATATSIDTVSKQLEKASDKKVVILFSSKNKSPPIFSVLSQSKHFKGRIGFVLATDKVKDVASQFEVTKFPTIVVASLDTDGQWNKELYEGPVDYTQIAKFLQKSLGIEDGASEAAAGATDDKKTKKAEDAKPKAEEKPRERRPASPVRPLELTIENFRTFCANGAPKVRGQQPFCVIAMQKSNIDIDAVHRAHENEAVHFFWIADEARSTWMQDFQDGLQPAATRLTPDDVIVLRASKDRTKFTTWRHLPEEEHGQKAGFEDFLGRCLGGDLTFDKNPGFPHLRPVA